MNNGLPPFFYDASNAYSGIIQPSNVHVTNTNLSRYYQKYLFEKAISVFKWELPENWDLNYFLYVLYYNGFIGVVNTDKYGVIPQFCSLAGYNIYYQPRQIIISNPLINRTVEPLIGIQCEVIKLQPTYTGIWDIVSYYADCMALISESFGVNSLNSKATYLFTAEDSTIAQSIRKMYDKIASGDPAVIVDKKLFTGTDGSIKVQPINSYDGEKLFKLLEVLDKLEYQFCTTVGIPTTIAYTNLLNSQIASHLMEGKSLAEIWYEQLQEGIHRTTRMFNINLKMEWRVTLNERGPAFNDRVYNTTRTS